MALIRYGIHRAVVTPVRRFICPPLGHTAQWVTTERYASLCTLGHSSHANPGAACTRLESFGGRNSLLRAAFYESRKQTEGAIADVDEDLRSVCERRANALGVLPYVPPPQRPGHLLNRYHTALESCHDVKAHS